MAKLAIAGGEKVIDRPLGKKWPIWDEREIRAVTEVVESGVWWRGGYREGGPSKVAQFEDAFAAYQQANYGVAVTNGTAALECALRAAGVAPGDEVLVPALTFVASAMAIAQVNAVPVFVDVDPETYNIDPGAMEAAITDRTAAAVVVHNGGYPADMDRVMEIASRRGIRVVEDAAHAHGSEWKNRRVGAIGDLGAFSFQMGKTLTCGEGGMVLTDDEALAGRVFSFQHIGQFAGRPFDRRRVGSNLRMTEWQGAILLAQLSRLDGQVETRERNTRYLAEGLREIDGVDPIDRDPRVTRWGFYYWNFHYRQERFDGVPRDVFLEAVQAEGAPIRVGAHGAPIYGDAMFEGVDVRRLHCPEAERVHANQVLAIGHTVFLGGQEDMDLILEAIRKVRANTDAVGPGIEERQR